MLFLDLSFSTPSHNLACDEALLDEREAGERDEATLRFWESPVLFVALGYSNHRAQEANLGSCREHGVPILRRASGGGTVLQGPGCLNYAVVLPIDEGASKDIGGTNRLVMERHQDVLTALLRAPVEMQGHTDLALDGRKFSGNAQHRRRRWLLFHGTFLLHFDLGLVEQFLQFPPRQPDYRQGRSHAEFLMNLHLPAAAVKAALCEAWGAHEPITSVPHERIDTLAREKFEVDEWNDKF